MTETLTLKLPATTGGGNSRIRHAEDPNAPGNALCGAKLKRGSTTAAGDRCVVCRDLTRRSFVAR